MTSFNIKRDIFYNFFGILKKKPNPIIISGLINEIISIIVEPTDLPPLRNILFLNNIIYDDISGDIILLELPLSPFQNNITNKNIINNNKLLDIIPIFPLSSNPPVLPFQTGNNDFKILITG